MKHARALLAAMGAMGDVIVPESRPEPPMLERVRWSRRPRNSWKDTPEYLKAWGSRPAKKLTARPPEGSARGLPSHR